MDRTDRETLKSYFRKGSIPTEEQFAALIDSMHNIHDDGEVKVTDDNGMVLAPTGDERTLVTIASGRQISADVAQLWRIGLAATGAMILYNGKGEAVMELGTDGSMVVHGDLFAGRCLSESPHGSDDAVRVRADGCWYNLPVESAGNADVETGCRAYRIYALWCSPDGRHRMLEAMASHSAGRNPVIRSGRKHWWGWSGKIILRWVSYDGRLYLQVRSRKAASGTIRCCIETLWNL